MIAFTPSTKKTPAHDSQSLFAETFRRQIQALEQGQARVRLPECRPTFQCQPGMAYHFKPELFIQLSGATLFTCLEENFSLEAGEICIMPQGVPHGETTRSTPKPFENVVVCYYNDTIAIHVAHETPAHKPIVDDIYFYTSPFFPALVSYLNQIGELRFHSAKSCQAAIKGLLLAELAMLTEIVETQGASLYSETERVFRCQWLIRNNIADPNLGVESLAEELRCSATHLSRLFHQETSERITEYITRIRLANALEALGNTSLSIKEISSACGFSDANYFAKVFKKAVKRSPVQFRDELHRVACDIEREPKVVYYDHAEHNFGLRPEVMAKAASKLHQP